MTIHWCGTGLSAVPGLRRLIKNGHDVCVWNRTIAKARTALIGLAVEICPMDRSALAARLNKGDIVVSMLPGDHHVPLAQMAIEAQAHFISSSYITPQMQALAPLARSQGVVLINEIGLDPGIDHLMAHWLVEDYQNSTGFSPDLHISFKSYCGGLPKVPNDFCYKFSWSPAGVLRALKSPSKSIKDFQSFEVVKPWDAISHYPAPLATTEQFEVYPNRDSLPFIRDYNFDPAWKVKNFVRGTLRPLGWSKAWAKIFETLDEVESEEAKEAKVIALSEELWQKYAYDEGEPDRVVLCVELKVTDGEKTHYHKIYTLDAHGDDRASAMARLVSIPVSLAVEELEKGKFATGLHAATSDQAQIAYFMEHIGQNAQYLKIVDVLNRG